MRGKLAPAVGRIVHIQPLPVGAAGGGGGVVGVEPAEGVELPRCADIHRFGCGGLCLRRCGALGKVGVIVIALAAHGELLIKRRCAGRVHIVGVGDLGGQGQEVIDLVAHDHRDTALRCERIQLPARIGQLERERLAGVVPEGDGVAVAHRHAVRAQGIGVRAAEGVHILPVFAVDLVIDQRAGLKLRLPVAVVIEGGKARIGIVRQTLRHEVIGVARAAGLGGEGARQMRRHEALVRQLSVGRVLRARKRRGGVVVAREVVDILKRPLTACRRGIAARIILQRQVADAVAVLRRQKRPRHESARRDGRGLVARGVEIFERGRTCPAADETAGGGRGEVAVGVDRVEFRRSSRRADEPARGILRAQDRRRHGGLDGRFRGRGRADEPAGGFAV